MVDLTVKVLMGIPMAGEVCMRRSVEWRTGNYELKSLSCPIYSNRIECRLLNVVNVRVLSLSLG